jgi:hypothetical protein
VLSMSHDIYQAHVLVLALITLTSRTTRLFSDQEIIAKRWDGAVFHSIFVF